MLLVGVEKSTPFSVMSCWSASGGWSGPVVVKFEPSVSVPEMWPLVLSKVASALLVAASLTSLSCSLVMNSP